MSLGFCCDPAIYSKRPVVDGIRLDHPNLMEGGWAWHCL